MSAPSPPKQVPSTGRHAPRSRKGCFTCRSRKVRCDEGTPTCHNCERLEFTCRYDPPGAGEDMVVPAKRRKRAPNGVAGSGRSPKDTAESPEAMGSGWSEGSGGTGTGTSAVGASTDIDATVVPGERTGWDGDGQDWIQGGGDDFLDLLLSGMAPVGEGWDGDAHFGDWSVFDAPYDPQFPQPQPTETLFPPLPPHLNDALGLATGLGEPESSDPALDSSNQRLVQHYLNVMKGYAKVSLNRHGNVYLTFFSYALTRPFLFHAILAFSSTHLATTDSSFDAVGRDHARTATTLLLTEVVSAYDETSIGPLLSTIFLLLQREMLSASSQDDVLALLRTAGSLLARPGASDALAKAGTVAARLDVLLAGKDSRASMFRLGGGSLIKALHADPRVSDVLAAAFNQSGAEPREAGVLELDLYKANVLLWRVAECDRRKFESAAAEEVELEVLRADLVAAIETFDVDLRLEIGASLTDSQYGRSVVAAVVHTAVLYLERIFPAPNFGTDSAARILHLSLAIARDPTRSDLPASIWPRPLFFAGLATDDAIYRDWVLVALDKGARWGVGVAKTRDLMKEVIQEEAKSGPCDILEVMRKSTGVFVL